MDWNPRKVTGTVAAILVGVVAVGWLFGADANNVDWNRVRGVVMESDDWGLCGFAPSREALADLDREDLSAGHFPPVYWGSTLEDSTAVARICALLLRYRGRDGLPAIFQPNYILSSLALEREGDDDRWVRRSLPDLPETYRRPGLWNAVREGMARGLWYPEIHGALHYDPGLRMDAALSNETSERAARRGVLIFPGSGFSWELGSWRRRPQLEREFDGVVATFVSLFGREPTSVIAPDYTWDARSEEIWSSRGVRVIQAKREQRYPRRRGGGLSNRFAKVVMRSWERLKRSQLVYLDRNCRLEVVQSAEPRAAANACVAAVRKAWDRGEPAIIETHRINFVHLDPDVQEIGLNGLDHVLDAICTDDEAPLFLTDDELGQLYRRGTSWCRRGDTLVVRNLTRGRKVVWIPEAGTASPGTAPGRLIILAPGENLVIPAADTGSVRNSAHAAAVPR
jgi:hypothetical protein